MTFTINISTKNNFRTMEHREIGMVLFLHTLMNNNTDYFEVLDSNNNLLFEATRVTNEHIRPKFMIKDYYKLWK